MSEINKISVLDAFVKYNELSWEDFTNKGIYNPIVNGTPRARLLKFFLRELNEEGITLFQKKMLPPTWKLIDKKKAKEKRIELFKTINQKNLDFKNYKVSKKILFWTIVLAILAIVISILIARHVI